LKEAARVRAELEEKLNMVTQSINTLAEANTKNEDELGAHKVDAIHPPFMDKGKRDEYLREE
jgi:hypothetical protein